MMKLRTIWAYRHGGRKLPVLRFAVLIALSLSTIGCGTLTQAQIDAREYRRADFKNRFVDYRRRCLANGGRIYIDAMQNIDKDGIPSRGDRYVCI